MSGAEASYSFGERALHRIALGNKMVPELTFDIERALFLSKTHAKSLTAPIFVCGLARAGTTIIMRSLHASGEVASLTYRDMPFPLAPNLWARVSNATHRTVASHARGHGDRLDHDLDSPEAIEEAFWKCFCGPDYIKPEKLERHAPDYEVIRAFEDLMRLVCLRYDKPRYLSKNNNNVLRLPQLKSHLSAAVFVHPFRHPVQQAISLRQQHHKATSLQGRDPFRVAYAAMLAHHEFGLAQRAFSLPGVAEQSGRLTLDYWLSQWIATYAYLIDIAQKIGGRHIFVDYDVLCSNPEGLGTISEELGLERVGQGPELVPPPHRTDGEVSASILRKAEDIHAALQRAAKSR